MAQNPAEDYVVANQGFATTYEGEPVFVQKGEFVPKTHPFVEGREELFDQATHFGRFDVPPPVEATQHDDDDDDVEQATAAPGEKRGAKKRS